MYEGLSTNCRKTEYLLLPGISNERYIHIDQKCFIGRLESIIRRDSKLNVQKCSCVKTEHLLRTQRTPNESYIHKEEKMSS